MLIPFEAAANSSSEKFDDTDLLKCLKIAGDAVPILISLGRCLEDEEGRSEMHHYVNDVLHKKNIDVNIRIKRTYAILMYFTVKV